MGIAENNCDFVKPSTGKKLLKSGIHEIEKEYMKNSFEKKKKTEKNWGERGTIWAKNMKKIKKRKIYNGE